MFNSLELPSRFWSIVDKQALNRGHALTPFNRKVAQTILTGAELALDDHQTGLRQYRVITAPTGSGKSSYAWALTAALTEVDPQASVAFLCETISQCEDTYNQMVKLVSSSDLAVWTTAHDASKSLDDIERRHGFRPSARFKVGDLKSYRVIIVTHRFYTGSGGFLTRFYGDEPRTLTIMDERPKEVSIFDIDHGDVSKARDWALQTFGETSDALSAFDALYAYVAETWRTERNQGKNFKGLRWGEASWFTEDEATTIHMDDPDSLQGRVIGFAQALARGFSFLARYRGTKKGGNFVGYRRDLPIYPGTLLLDATADIDGVKELVDWRWDVTSPRVSYSDLTVTHLAPPRTIVASGERITEIVKQPEKAGAYADWIKQTIFSNTQPGELVLVVVHKRLIADERLPDNISLGEDAYDMDGRKVAFINWGFGIGSNRWKNATSVFLFGEYHVPKRTTVATVLGLLNTEAGPNRLTPLQSPNSQEETLITVQNGHLHRWERQLAMRGNARNLTPDGICGQQNLFVTSGLERFVLHKEVLFPGATFVLDESALEEAKEQGGGLALAALLLSHGGDVLTSSEIEGTAGVSLAKHGARLRSYSVVQQAMHDRGWTYEKRGGRGRRSQFTRSTGTSDVYCVGNLVARSDDINASGAHTVP